MVQRMGIVIGGAMGVGLIALALWTWRDCDPIALRLGARNLSLAAMALRCAAVSSAAVGEGTIVYFVLGALWRRDAITRAIELSAVLVFLLSCAGAVALGLAGR